MNLANYRDSINQRHSHLSNEDDNEENEDASGMTRNLIAKFGKNFKKMY